VKIALACSHGGHFTEMLRLMPAFEGYDIVFITYHSAREAEVQRIAPAHFLDNIGTNPLRMLRAFFRIWKVLTHERPDVVLTTGAEIGLPAILLARVLGMHTVYIESWCRTRTPSLTGRLVYPIAHEFLVQWPDMLDVYGPRARFEGSVA